MVSQRKYDRRFAIAYWRCAGSVAGLQMKEEVRTLEHRLDNHLRAFQKVACAASFHREEFAVARGFIRSERTAECSQSEFFYESVAAGGIGGAGRFARNQVIRISAAEGVAGQLFGGLTVGFRQQRRHALPFGLVGEAVDEVLGRELGRRAGIRRLANREQCCCIGCASVAG